YVVEQEPRRISALSCSRDPLFRQNDPHYTSLADFEALRSLRGLPLVHYSAHSTAFRCPVTEAESDSATRP
uniref:Uncharacterized protein n=1 Tax=Parascaris equorum TaxID=6256 RepID=A0A914RLV8_PAREQ